MIARFYLRQIARGLRQSSIPFQLVSRAASKSYGIVLVQTRRRSALDRTGKFRF